MNEAEVARLWEAQAQSWTEQARAGRDIYRDAHNTPAFLEELPPVAGLCGLDIGCGEGGNTRLVRARGASMSGIDLAPTFIARAAEAEEPGDPQAIAYQVASATRLPFAAAGFDFVVSFMCFMDFPDQAPALMEVCRVLKPGGFFQFSILHPCFAPPYRKVIRDSNGVEQAIEVGRYFETSEPKIERWHFSTTPPEERAVRPPFELAHFHRTLSQWVGMIVASGLQIEALFEPMADVETAARIKTVADTRIAPLFLHFRLRKPGL